MEEALWFVQQTMLELLDEMPRTREETVQEVFRQAMRGEYGLLLATTDNPLFVCYTLFDALKTEQAIVAWRVRGYVIEYCVPIEVSTRLKEWRLKETRG